MRRAAAAPVTAPPAGRLLDLIQTFRGRRVLVVGDLIADEFIYGRVARVSREAPVLILEYDSTEIVPGGAGNAANNVAALGARAAAVGIVGRDDAGRRLWGSLHTGVEKSRLARVRDYHTPVKTRILAGGIHSAKQQVVRIDRVVRLSIPPATREPFERHVLEAASGCDAVLLSDYGLGLVTPSLASRIRDVVGGKRAIPVLVDSRYELVRYTGLTACTPNESEVEALLKIRIGDNADTLERAGREMLKRTRMQAVLVTRGSRGMALFEPKRPTIHIPIVGSDQIVDVTGAGDTVIATLSAALASGATFHEGALLANYAGGLVVMKRGTATVSAAELAAAVGRETQNG